VSGRATGWLLAAYLVALWGEQLLYELAEVSRINPSDLVLALAALSSAPRLLRDRAWLRSPVVWLAAAISASLALSTVLAGDRLGLDTAGRLLVQPALVVVVASAWRDPEARRIVERAAVGVALAFSAVTLVGGGLGALGAFGWLEQWAWRPAFVDVSGHPRFGEWPRLVGGLSMSAETCGVWALAAASVLAAWRRRWMLLPVAVAVGTLSIAGAMIVVVIAAAAGRAPVWVLAIAAVLAVQWPVHVSPAPTGVVCVDTWPNHWAAWRAPDGVTCDVRTTRYALAKQHALEVWRDRPLTGAGAAGFERHARAERRADGWESWNPYHATHGAYHGVLAEQGLVGVALWIALAVAVARRIRGRLALVALFLAFAAAAIDLDVHEQRLLWFAVGISAALVPGRSARRSAPAPGTGDGGPRPDAAAA
jgi:O-antigen ligase